MRRRSRPTSTAPIPPRRTPAGTGTTGPLPHRRRCCAQGTRRCRDYRPIAPAGGIRPVLVVGNVRSLFQWDTVARPGLRTPSSFHLSPAPLPPVILTLTEPADRWAIWSVSAHPPRAPGAHACMGGPRRRFKKTQSDGFLRMPRNTKGPRHPCLRPSVTVTETASPPPEARHLSSRDESRAPCVGQQPSSPPAAAKKGELIIAMDESVHESPRYRVKHPATRGVTLDYPFWLCFRWTSNPLGRK